MYFRFYFFFTLIASCDVFVVNEHEINGFYFHLLRNTNFQGLRIVSLQGLERWEILRILWENWQQLLTKYTLLSINGLALISLKCCPAKTNENVKLMQRAIRKTSKLAVASEVVFSKLCSVTSKMSWTDVRPVTLRQQQFKTQRYKEATKQYISWKVWKNPILMHY